MAIDPIKWAAGFTSRGTVVTTDMNALGGSGSRTSLSGATQIDNTVNLDQYGKLILNVTFPSSPSAGAYVGVYMIVALDGTNYEDGDTSVDPGLNNLIAQISVRLITTAQVLTTNVFAMVPAKTKFIVINQANTLMANSGNTLTLYTANDAVNV